MAKLRVLVLAGGQSGEHEISLLSTRSMLQELASERIEVTPLVIAKDGTWLDLEASRSAIREKSVATGGLPVLRRAGVAHDFDVVFPLLHGPHGEDGTVQGMLELGNIPYVGSGVLASSLCMDKAMCKDVLKSHGLTQLRYTLTTRAEWMAHPEQALHRAAELSGPWFVKPANLGSSVGITKAKTKDELRASIVLALEHDRRVIIEEGLPSIREVEVAVMGNDAPEASPVGEIHYDAEFYDYETKYTPGRSSMSIPAKLPEEVARELRAQALLAYRALDCAGLARVDFFYQESTGKAVINELNTIPGFTPFSMFTKLWMATGLTYTQVVEKLVDHALERHRR